MITPIELDYLKNWWAELDASLRALSPRQPCFIVKLNSDAPFAGVTVGFSVCNAECLPAHQFGSLAFLSPPEDVPLRILFSNIFKPLRHNYFRVEGGWRKYNALSSFASKLIRRFVYFLERKARQKPLLMAGKLANAVIDFLDAVVPVQPNASDGLGLLLAQITTGEKRKNQLDGIIGKILASSAKKYDGNGVAFVLPSLSAGGAERQAVLLATAMTGHGWTLRFLVKHLDSDKQQDFYVEALRRLAVECAEPLDRLQAHADFALIDEISINISRFSPNLRRLIGLLYSDFRRTKPQAVIAWMDEMMVAAGIAAVLAGVPSIILSGRNLRPTNFETIELGLIAAALHGLAKSPRVFLTNNSRAGANDYAAWLGLQPNAITVIRNVFQGLGDEADAEAVAQERRRFIRSGQKLIGGVFRFAEEKNPMLWLRCAAELMRRDSEIHFVLYGDGPLRQMMEAVVCRLGLEGRLHMPGLRRDVAVVMQACDALLLTSEVEGTPNVLLEAQWLGVPCTARCVGGVAEAAPEEGLVLMTESNTPEFLAGLLERQLRWTAAELERRKKTSRDFILSEFNSTRAFQRHVDILNGKKLAGADVLPE